MKINKYRVQKAIMCFQSGIQNGRNIYWSFRLSLWWFSSGFDFEADK